MRLKLSPQRNDTLLEYASQGEELHVKLGEETEVLDLSGTWGHLEPDEEGKYDTLGVLLGGRKENGEITLTVRSHHPKRAPNSARFPEPFELADGQTLSFPEEVFE